jgi:hypothetical protein
MDCRLRKSGDVASPPDADPEQIIKDWVAAACTHERLSLAEIEMAVGSNPTESGAAFVAVVLRRCLDRGPAATTCDQATCFKALVRR